MNVNGTSKVDIKSTAPSANMIEPANTIVIKKKKYFANKSGQFECEKYFQKKPLIESLKSSLFYIKEAFVRSLGIMQKLLVCS